MLLRLRKEKLNSEGKMVKNRSLISAVREGNLERVSELINTFTTPYAKEWSEGYDLLLVALDRNHRKIAKLLLLNGSKVNSTCEFSITPLHYAAAYGDVELVEMLLNRNAQIDAKDISRRTSLHYAIEKNQVQIVKLLLNRGVCVNANDRDGFTPLHVASKENRPEIVEILLNCGAYINAATYVTPIQNIQEGYTPLHYAVEVGSQQITKLLLNENADVHVKAYCGTPLHIAVQEGNQQIVLDLLNYGASVNSECTSTGYTPLHVAALKGSTDIARLLLSKGADVNTFDKDNLTPLYIASDKEHKSTVTLLLEHGANVDAQNGHCKITVLCHAVEKGYSDIIEEILKFSPDLNNESYRAALYFANIGLEEDERKYKRIVGNLLEYGCRLNSKDVVNTRRYMQIAVEYGYLKVVGDFLRFGMDVNIKSTSNKRTLLHIAAINQQEKVVELLINCGANVNAKDADMKTPIFYAVQNCHLKITKLLLANEASIKDDIDLLISAVDKECIEIVGILLQCDSDIDVNGRCKKPIFHRTDPNAVNPNPPDFQEELAKRLRLAGIDREVFNTHIKPEQDTEVTPLHISAARGHIRITQMLLNKGADVNAKKDDGTTALHVAAHMGHVRIVELLLKYGAEVDARSKSGIMPLHIAAERSELDIVEALIKFGADVDSINEGGRTALHIACRLGLTDIIVNLLQHGIDINIRCKNNFTALNLALPHDRRYGLFLRDSRSVPKNVKAIVQHIAKLKTGNLFVNEGDLQTINASQGLKHLYIRCKKEIGEMTGERGMIHNTNVSFYHILVGDVHQLSIYARNERILEVFESNEYAGRFPVHADMLKSQFKKGRERLCLMKSSAKSFKFLSGYELPHLSTDKVCSYLSNLNLKDLINACSCDVSDER